MTITRRGFLAASGTAAYAAAGSRPNILLIVTDQQSHDSWSGAGNPWLKTPAMDSLAASGTTFEQAHCTYPVCSPSRSSIFTSRMPHETDVMVNGRAIRDGIPTLGEIFREAGYATVYGGKWHLPKPFVGMTGFECIAGGHSLGARMDAPLADACASWLNRKPQQPFLMVASFMNPHDVCQWIRDHKGSRTHPSVGSFPPAPANMAVDPLEPECIQYHRTAGYDLMSQAVGIASDWRRDDMRLYLHDYYRMVEDVDLQIGRVLAALRDAGLDANTLVAFISDHGEGLGAHRWAQKAAFWEEVVRVPMILRGPGVRAGHVNRDLVSLLDLLPTFCDYAGLDVPPGIRGRSLRPALEGGAIDRQFVVSELRYGTVDREGRMLRTRRYKYVKFNSGTRTEQLFDLETDPGEVHNLAASRTAAEVLKEHRDLLARWCRETDDSFPAHS